MIYKMKIIISLFQKVHEIIYLEINAHSWHLIAIIIASSLSRPFQ